MTGCTPFAAAARAARCSRRPTAPRPSRCPAARPHRCHRGHETGRSHNDRGRRRRDRAADRDRLLEPREQSLPRPGDLRRRVVRGPGRGRPDRGGERRQHPVARRHTGQAGGGHDLDHGPPFRSVLLQRDLRDPASIADRRAVRRLPARHLKRAAPAQDHERRRGGTYLRSPAPAHPSTQTSSRTSPASRSASRWA